MASTMKTLDLPIQDPTHSTRPDMANLGKLSRRIRESSSYTEKKALLVEHCRSMYFDVLEHMTDEEVYARLHEEYANAQTYIASIFSVKFLPMSVIKPQMIPLSNLRSDPVNLYEIAFAPTIEDPATQLDRRRFEARRVLEIGNRFFDLGLIRMTMVEQPLAWITNYLIRNKILAEKPRRRKFCVWHDKTDKLRYRGITLTKEPIQHKDHCVCLERRMRTALIETGQASITVLYQLRAKTASSIIRKRIILEDELDEDERDLEHNTPDILALRLICLRPGELGPLNEVVISNLPHGTILKWKDRREKDAPEKNRYSAKEYKDIEYLVSIIEPTGIKRYVEIQLLTAEVHFNVENSALEMNHRRYEARQLLANMYPLLEPEQIYRFDWNRPGLKKEIEDHIARDVMKSPK